MGDELVVAHRELGIVRTDRRVNRFDLPSVPSVTEQDWPDAPRWPSHVEAVGDVAVFAGTDGVGMTWVCPE